MGIFEGGSYFLFSQSFATNGDEEIIAPESEIASWGAVKAMYRSCDPGDDDKRNG
jgi:hypothetical protein